MAFINYTTLFTDKINWKNQGTEDGLRIEGEFEKAGLTGPRAKSKVRNFNLIIALIFISPKYYPSFVPNE